MVDMNQFMKQAQAMQSKFAEMQAEMANKEYEGSAGGGMVKIIIKGDGKMKNINIDPSLLNKDEADTLEDLIVAAHNDALTKKEEDSQGNMSKMMGGFQLPPGFKMPF
ncbi:MAG: YbaB/EbfC family nucleoid-associated protein [Rickettsiales bacterium]|nr:YbaB/EbfC family nucleoid-associated protein [Rickettsiales bacterium]